MVRLHDREYEHLLATEKECLSHRQELRLANVRIFELDSANRHLQAAIHEADARVALAEIRRAAVQQAFDEIQVPLVEALLKNPRAIEITVDVAFKSWTAEREADRVAAGKDGADDKR